MLINKYKIIINNYNKVLLYNSSNNFNKLIFKYKILVNNLIYIIIDLMN